MSAINLQKKLRLKLLDICYQAHTGHIGSALSCLDILISIFFYKKQKNDVVILSKGHGVAALYCCLHELGVISDDLLVTYDQDGTILPAHPAPNKFADIPFATGSLGHGFPIASGIAKANKLAKKHGSVFVILSDGETNEGTSWETAHFAVKHKLDNLIAIIDKNKIQAFDRVEDVLGDTAQKEKWVAMGLEVEELDDGHNLDQLNTVINTFQKEQCNGKPKLIIANTIKGKGVSYMEDTIDWHYNPMDRDLYEKAIGEINTTYHA